MNARTVRHIEPAPPQGKKRGAYGFLRRLRASTWLRLTLAVALLAVVFWAAEPEKVGQVLAQVNPWLVAAAAACFLPQWVLSTWRWRHLVPGGPLAWSTAWQHQMVAASLNLVVPAKLGDLGKVGLLVPRVPWTQATAAVLSEKLWDLAALALLLGWGWVGPGALVLWAIVAWLGAWGWARLKQGSSSCSRLGCVAGLSVLLWGVHLLQIWWFGWACGLKWSWAKVCQVVPLALVAGQLPLTWWGLGTRDAVLVAMLVPPAQTEQMLVLAALLASRYLVPGSVGALWCLLKPANEQPTPLPARKHPAPNELPLHQPLPAKQAA